MKVLMDMARLKEQVGNVKEALYYYTKVMEKTDDKEMIKQVYYQKLAILNTCDVSKEVKEIVSQIVKADVDYQVFQGPMSIANQSPILAKGLNERGISTVAMNFYPSYLAYEGEFSVPGHVLRRNSLDYEYLYYHLISQFKVFHFHFGTTFHQEYLDLKIINSLGKKIVMHYWGSDVRKISSIKEMNPYVTVKIKDEKMINNRLTCTSKYADCVIVADIELFNCIKDFHKNIAFLPVAIETEKYKGHDKFKWNNIKPLIVHAPTSPEFKGTHYILEAIKELEKKYEFDFKHVQHVSHEEAKKIYAEADLVIDQIRSAGHGLLAVECMSMGKPIICSVVEEMRQFYPSDLPIVSANPENILEKIVLLLEDGKRREELGIAGSIYARKIHDYKIVTNRLLEIYGEFGILGDEGGEDYDKK